MYRSFDGKGVLIKSSNPCRDTSRHRWHNAGSRTRAGTVLRVGEGNPNVIVRKIIEYPPNVDDNVPFPSTLERLVRVRVRVMT